MRISVKVGGLIGVVALAACASHVSQDRSTGPDGKITGALPLPLAEGQGKVRGVVSYPGGDRVDWTVIALPAKLSGKLDLELSWTAPRPGLELRFDVFDGINVPVTGLGMSYGSKPLMRSASVDGAAGTYYIRVYAPRRIDAGEYTLQATFTPSYRCVLEVDDPFEGIEDPPPLPAVPSADVAH